MNLWERIKKQLNRKLTVMFIPHSQFQPIRIHLSLALLVFMAVSWTGLTLWSGFIATRHVDYWRAKAEEQVLRAKVWYFAQEMKRSREYLDRVRETEIALQNLLNMKTRKAIVESDNAMGGPTPTDQKQLSQLLAGRLRLQEMKVQEMGDQLEMFKRTGSDVLADFQEISRYIRNQHDIYRTTPLSWPTDGHVTSAFGRRTSPLDDYWVDSEFHRGIDIANKSGTPVRATADGVVRLASWQGGYGRLVIIDHGHGYRTYYAHNSRLLVKVGDRIKRGQTIADMGTSGHSTGYHLHYEVWENGHAVNPMRFVKGSKE